MEYKRLSRLLGGSIFAEEYRGDLIVRRTEGDELESAKYGPDERIAADLLVQVSVCVLRGNIKAALTFLSQFYEHSTGKQLAQRWFLRHHSLHALCLYVRRYPPLLRFRSEEISKGATLREYKSAYTKNIADATEKIRIFFERGVANATETDRLEAWATICMWNVPYVIRAAAVSYHPKYPKIDDTLALNSESGKRATSQLDYLADVAKIAARSHGITERYLRRLRLEILFAMSSPEYSTQMQSLLDSYQEAKDIAGLASLKLFKADNVISLPFTRPIALNLFPVDASIEQSLWDGLENDSWVSLSDVETATSIYQEAFELYEASQCPRGCAAVLLHQACLLHLQAMPKKYHVSSAAEYSTLLGIAAGKLAESALLFGDDEVNQQIVQAHQILLDIGQHRYQDTAGKAAAIGRWGLQACNENVAEFIGCLFLRFGRRLLLDNGATEEALCCASCAYQCFSALGDSYSTFQAVIFRAWIHSKTLNNFAALYCVDQSRPFYSNLMTEVKSLIQGASFGPIQKLLRLTKWDIEQEFYELVHTTYRSTPRLSEVTEWEETSGAVYDQELVRDLTTGYPQSKRINIEELGYPNLDDTIREAPHNNELLRLWDAVRQTFKTQLLKANLDAADSAVHAFISKAHTSQASLVFQCACLIRAYSLIGESEKAKAIWSPELEHRLFNGRPGLPHYRSISDVALMLCVKSHDWKRGHRLLTEIQQKVPNYLEPLSAECGNEEEFRSRFAHAGLILEQTNHYREAVTCLLQSYNVTEAQRASFPDLDGKQRLFAQNVVANLFKALARICIRAHQSGIPPKVMDVYKHRHPVGLTWLDHGLLFIEAASGRTLVDTLTRTARVLMPSETERIIRVTKMRKIWHLFVIPSDRRSSEEEAELRLLQSELEPNNEINDSEFHRMNEGHELPNPKDIFSAVPSNALVIQARFSQFGMTLLGVNSAGVQYSEIRPVTDIEIRKSTLGFMRMMNEHGGPEDRHASNSKAHSMLQAIARELLDPISDLISSKEHIIFNVGQPLTAFPFAALPYRQEPLFLSKAVSQIPSFAALLHQRNRAPTAARDSMKVTTIVKAGTLKDFEKSAEDLLPMAGIEAMAVSRMFSSWPKEAKRLDRTDFLQLFQKSNVLHVATHGSLDVRSPWMSYISLRERFRILDLALPESVDADLIVFAACFSGMGTGTASDDVVGFSHIVLGTGCRAYIGALWKVNDIATMLLFVLFYRLLKDNKGSTIAELWRRAQRALYYQSRESAQNLMRELVTMWDEAEKDGCQPNKIVRKGKNLLLRNMKTLDFNFKDPFYWAAFGVVGFGAATI